VGTRHDNEMTLRPRAGGNSGKGECMTIVIVATIFPAPEHYDEVTAAFDAAVPDVHTEPGCELYALHDLPGQLVLIEKWTSPEALDDHRTAPAFLALGPKIEGKLARPTEVQYLDPRPRGIPAQGAL
jgi:quinol monooxygenase YgiN